MSDEAPDEYEQRHSEGDRTNPYDEGVKHLTNESKREVPDKPRDDTYQAYDQSTAEEKEGKEDGKSVQHVINWYLMLHFFPCAETRPFP